MIDTSHGAARSRSRDKRRNLIAGSVMAAGVAFGLAASNLQVSQPVVTAATVVFLALVAVGEWASWRDRDEVERVNATTAFAASGLSLLLLFPLLKLLQPSLHLQDPISALGVTCTGIGLSVWAIRRLTN